MNTQDENDLELAIISTIGPKTFKKYINYMKLEYPLLILAEEINWSYINEWGNTLLNCTAFY